ncbi:hypothetical protein Scep_026284 [Stephania cephalantha]|uniref:Uncharacterized protein n=1 Tax=Stephania cephalantha TaxID=152367 RepID=A0AAP0HT68_9MAGN
MARRPSDRIPTDGDLDGQPKIGGGGGRTPAARGVLLEPYFRWDPSIDKAIVGATYDAKACVRYGALMHELRTLAREALDKDEDDEVTPNDVFLHVHTKDHDGVTFIDSRSTQFHAKLVKRREEHTQATPD